MPRRKHDAIDSNRRRLVARLGLIGTLAYTAPALTAFGTARASGISGLSGPSRASRPSAPSRPAPRQAPPPELVLLTPAGLSLGALEEAGYRVISAASLQSLAGTLLRIGLPAGRSVAAARAELAALLPGAVADANHLYRPDEFLCDDDGCDAHEMIGWSGWTGSAVPRIGMIDTGINPDHDALRGQRLSVHQTDLSDRSAAGRQHGTAIAALLLGRADSRVPGLLPNAHLVAVEAFHSDAGGDAADAFAVAAALDLLLNEGVSVINMSFSGPENAVVERMARRAAEQNVGLVAAAGNGGPGAGPAFPAAWPHVLAVTAVDHRLQPYRQANRGAYVSFAAPGVNLWTAASISGGRFRSGTSYAAPFVTAALAVERARHPGEAMEATLARLARCAGDLGPEGHDPAFGHGLIRAPGQCAAEGAAILPVFPAVGE